MKPPKPLTAFLSSLLLSSPLGAEIVERVIARVNGDIITQSELEARQVAEVQSNRIPPERIEAFLRENNSRILQEAIDELLIVQKAADLGMRMRPEYIREVIEGIKKENNISSDEAFQEQLRREGMSLDDLKRNIERSIMRRQVLSRELDSKTSVTEVEARADYEARKDEYTKPASVRLQEISVKSESGDALALARQLVERARAGEDFGALARAHSASSTRASGGDLGLLLKGEINPDVEKIVFSLSPGSVSEPFPAGEGFQIFRVIERTEGSVVPFEDVKADILRKLNQARTSEAYEKFVEGLRKTAIVDLKVREVSLQVDVPASESILDPAREAAPASPGAAPALPESEFTVSPQAKPERVAPPGTVEKPAPDSERKKEEEKKPSPRPTPTPIPPSP
jgi:parvulin-like peptidyl-prolyl isomerase